MNLNVTILRPGGNDTALVKGIPPMNQKRKINDQIMQQYPNVEQVGFYSDSTLEMAGGEFCGNALRSLAFLLLKGQPGEINLTASGSDNQLVCGVTPQGEAFAQMPIVSDFSSVKKISKKVYRVDLQGITHLITKRPTGNPDQLKAIAKELLSKADLLTTVPAAGVMFITEANNQTIVDPVVWVRDIQTLFYETACASGTTAIGLLKALPGSTKEQTYVVTQPSGKDIEIFISKNSTQFSKAIIKGPIEILKGGD